MKYIQDAFDTNWVVPLGPNVNAKVREYDYGEVNKEIEAFIRTSLTYDPMAIVGKMKEIVPEYKSNNSVYCALDHE